MSSLWSRPAAELLDATASAEATPGGGATAAVAAAFGAALLSMAVGISQKREASAELENAGRQVTALRRRLQALADEDVQAFGQYVKASHLPSDDPGRPEALQAAGETAMQVPLTLARTIVEGLEAAQALAPQVHPEVVSDVGAGASLLQGALLAALLTVEINLPHVAADARGAIQAEHDRLKARGMGQAQATLDSCAGRLRQAAGEG
ncbi:cyclodeaminase/cyclohydrolase family protein [Deinococcus multiflagellatus]|uniref:Cyclodeaminase/cyclohydrolase family protein n=1 Tax=Deinococcus multiflagellatus TaxID=1656887 RepID=A0ABW1ZHR6_9DEIO|nr:cyclodeaminase/cyclohydrolase family protein [Deinococcus multiflagellatus]MBZ9711950.1 cyclodeaminase/cyclohydrolase family protein [Deinococcus multiflagellatus]